MIKIAAVDSSVADKAAANVVCDGVNDQADINTALGGGNSEVFLFNGHYGIDAPIDLPSGAVLRGASVAGVFLNCNTTSGVVRSSAPASIHEHVLLDSLRFAPGTQNDLGADLRGFVRSQFNRLRIGSFDVGVWFGGNVPTYASSWTNEFSHFYLSNNQIGFKFSGTSAGGSSTANNITLSHGEIICKDASGAIGVEVIEGEVIVDTCDIGYADQSHGIVLRENAGSCRIVNSRFEWDDQGSGIYPVLIEEGSLYHYIAGNIYTDACSVPNVFDANGASGRFVQIDGYDHSSVGAIATPKFNEANSNFYDVRVGRGNDVELYSDNFSTSTLTLEGSAGALSLDGFIYSTGSTPAIAANAAAGTGGSAVVFGTDTSGIIRVDTGTGPTTGQLFTLTWTSAKPSSDNYAVVITAANSNAVTAMQRIFMDQDNATDTTISAVAVTALPASQFYKFYYQVISYTP
jgi:hypothetical protein